MKRRIWTIVAAAIVGLTGVGLLPGKAISLPAETISESVAKGSPDFAPGRIIVKLEEEAATSDLTSLNRKNDASIEEKIPETDLSVVDLPKDLSVTEAVERYEDSPNVEYAEPDYEVQLAASTNDSSYYKQWSLNNTGQTYWVNSDNKIYSGVSDADIDAPEAWNVTSGSASTVVAVIDTGMDTSHPDLNDNVWTNPDEIANNNKDDDNNGYVDDVHGWDFFNDNNTVFDSANGARHGTHVSGTIAAERNNGFGSVGVAPNVKVMPLKFIHVYSNGDDKGYISDAVEALNYAVAEGAEISNNSYGYHDSCNGCYARSLEDAIKAADQKDHLFVTSAGNNSDDNDAPNPSYPASYDSPNIVSVAATDASDQLSSFSNHGATSVDLAAPGQTVLSTIPEKSYSYASGTSMASPHVAGVAALVKSKFPGLDNAGIKSKILSTVDKKTSLTGKMVSGGRLNAAKAVGATSSTAPVVTRPKPPPNTAPVVTSLSPNRKKVRDRTPTIRTNVQDAQTNLTKSNIRLYLDGQRRSKFSYNASTNRLTFKPAKPLGFRRHTVKVVATDPQGLGGNRAKSFKIVR